MTPVANEPHCPAPEMLKEFLLGKLEPPHLDVCESHLSECDTCHETLRGLDAEDTFSALVSDAVGTPAESLQDESHVAIRRLVDRLILPETFAAEAVPDDGNGVPAPSPDKGDLELLADRAAEVLRCLAPTGESLGSIGNYDLIRLIGAGSSGVVFKANDRTLNRTVALKVLRPSLGPLARQRFLAEAKAAAAIEHVNVITIYQVGEQDRLAYLAMQWIPGQTLDTRLQRSPSSTEASVRHISREICKGLAAAHQKQMIHRDIKPANIWICEDESIKLLDFGLARIADDDSGLTATGMLAGTPNYMSPEQARGLELDARTDLFSLGCLMYRLLTGRLPFGAATVLGTLQAIQNHHPDRVHTLRPDISEDLADLTMALLEKQPANRPDSASQVIEMLKRDRNEWPSPLNHYGETRLDPTNRPLAARTTSAIRQTSLPQADGTHITTEAPAKRTRKLSTSGKSRWAKIGFWVAIGAMLFAAAGYLAGPQIIRIATNQGELIIETDDSEDIQIEILKNGERVKVVDVQSSSSLNIQSGVYQIQARSRSGAEPTEFNVQPGSLTMTRGGKQIVKVTQPTGSTKLAPNSSVAGNQVSDNPRNQSGFQPTPTTIQPTYNGETFDYWMQVASIDRHPKTFAHALEACAELAETEAQRDKVVALVRLASEKYRMDVVGANNDNDRILNGCLHALRQLPMESIADFYFAAYQSKNENAIRFCVWLHPGVGLSTGEQLPLGDKERADLAKAFVARTSAFLRMPHRNLRSIVDLALPFSTEQISVLDPKLKATLIEIRDTKRDLAEVDTMIALLPLMTRMGLETSGPLKQVENVIQNSPVNGPQFYQAVSAIGNYQLLPWPTPFEQAHWQKQQGELQLRPHEIEKRLELLLRAAERLLENWEKGNDKVPLNLEQVFHAIYQHLNAVTEETQQKTVIRLEAMAASQYFKMVPPAMNYQRQLANQQRLILCIAKETSYPGAPSGTFGYVPPGRLWVLTSSVAFHGNWQPTFGNNGFGTGGGVF